MALSEHRAALPLATRAAGRGGAAGHVRRRLAGDGAFWRRLLIAGGGNALGRALGLLLTLLLAALFLPADYGYIRWAMSAAMLAAIPAAAAPNALARALGAARGAPRRQERLVLVGLAMVVVGTLVCAAGAALAFQLMGRPAVGVFVVLVGMTWFQGAMAVYRGTGAAWRMAALYVGGNALQLAAILVLCGPLGLKLPDLALAIYAFAWLAVLVLLEWRRLPRPDGGGRWPPGEGRALLAELVRLWAPLTLAHAGWALWIWADVVLVDYFLGAAAAGYYGLARTVVTLFLLVPEAVAMLLLPHVAAEGRGARGLTARLLALTALVSGALLAGVALLGPPLLAAVADGRYAEAAVPLPGLALGMALYALYMVLEQHLVGLGHPGAHVAGVAVMALGVLVGGAWLLPRLGLLGMSLVFPLAALAGLATLVLAGRGALCAPAPAAGSVR